MVDHNIATMSESEEMYLITIARLVEQGVEEPVSISRLARELSIQPVDYFPYKGAQFTPKGQEVASQVLRDRRLWEVFLVNHLELPPSEADALACRLEHITPEGVTCRLAKFLGHPSFTPQGFPIPEVNGVADIKTLQSLTELAVGEWGEIMRIGGDPATRAFLESEGFRPGIEVHPLAVSSGGAMLLQVGTNRLHLSETVVNKILFSF